MISWLHSFHWIYREQFVLNGAVLLRIPENVIGSETVFAPDRHVDGCRRQRKRIEASEFISETSLLWILTVLFFDYSFLFTGTQIALW